MFEVSNRTLIVAIAVTSACMAACKDKPAEPTVAPAPAPPTTPHDGVTLISAGDPPLQPLRYRLTKGDKTTSELAWDFDARTDGKSDALPTLVLDLETTVEDVAPSGAAQLRVSVTRATFRPKAGAPAPSEGLAAEIAAMQGVSLTETLAPDGAISGGKLDAKAVADSVRSRLDALAHSLEQAAMRLPSEPVGTNASWRERKTLPEGGIRAVSETTYTLTSLTSSIATYTATSTATGEPQTLEQDGLKVDVSKVAGRSETKGAVDLAHYAPQVKATSSFSTTMDVHAPAGTPGAGSSTIEIATSLDVAPAPPPSDAGAPPSDAGAPLHN